MGQGPALARNATTLDKDLAKLSCVILSHGHYDHAGGLLHTVKMNPGIRVISHPAVFSAHMKLEEGKTTPHPWGIPYAMRELEEFGAFSNSLKILGKSARASGSQGMSLVFSKHPRRSLDNGKESQKRLRTRVSEDDASLVMETPSGPCIVLGCAHAGVRNILEHVQANLRIDHIHAVIGGTHSGPSDRAETFGAISALEKFNVQLVAPAHCTGSGAAEVLRAYFGTRYCEALAGTEFVF